MNSSLIGKIEKAKRYEKELERISFKKIEIDFDGEHNVHKLSLNESKWRCDCSSFPLNGTCSHVMAMQRILAPMLSPEARYGPDALVNNALHDGEAEQLNNVAGPVVA